MPTEKAWITIDLGKSQMKNTRGYFSATINPFIKFYKNKSGSDSDDNLLLVYEIESVYHETKPNFEPFSMSLNTFCNGHLNIPIVIELWDYKIDGALVN